MGTSAIKVCLLAVWVAGGAMAAPPNQITFDRSNTYPIWATPTQADTALAMAIQLELNRLGCEAGTADGIWGRGSRAALARYALKVGATELPTDPSDDLLTLLRGENGRLCTLPPGVVAAENRSDTAHLEAVKYSYKVWSTMPSQVATERTEYGLLRCQAGRGSTPRVCSWVE